MPTTRSQKRKIDDTQDSNNNNMKMGSSCSSGSSKKSKSSSSSNGSLGSSSAGKSSGSKQHKKKIGAAADHYQAGTSYEEHRCEEKRYTTPQWNALSAGQRNYLREQARKKKEEDAQRKQEQAALQQTKKSLKAAKTAGALFDAVVADAADDGDGELPTSMTMEGLAGLAEALGIDYDDPRVLLLAWKLGSKGWQKIEKADFLASCETHGVTSLATLKSVLLPQLDTGFLDQDDFKEYYKFCFQFNLEGTHKAIDKETVVELWKLVLKGRVDDERLETWCAFCQHQKTYTKLLLDQWTMFLDFCHRVPDLSAYDESGPAWPVLIDEYVEYMEEQQARASK